MLIMTTVTSSNRPLFGPDDIEIVMQTIFNDDVSGDFDLVLIDEAHHEAAMTIQLLLESIGGCPIIGLTADDQRADGVTLKFDHFVRPITRQEAVERGFLAETDLTSIVVHPKCDMVEWFEDVVTNFGHEMRQSLAFFSTRKEVMLATCILQELGYKAVGLDTQSHKQVQEILDRFKLSEIQFIVSCEKLGEGIDVPICSDVLIFETIASYMKLNQKVGRGARPQTDCRIWECINAMSGDNLDTTYVVGTPRTHRLLSKRQGRWVTRYFDYTDDKTNLLHQETADE